MTLDALVRVSVLIPTLNAEGYLQRQVAALRQQKLQPYEICVIDSSSTDSTVSIARELDCRVDVIARTSFNHGGTRNLAARWAQGDVLVFMTQDALPVDDLFLGSLVDGLRAAESAVAAAYARQLPYPDAAPTEVFARTFNYPPESHTRTARDIDRLGIKAFFFSNVASAVTRSAFDAVGGFPERTIANEDMLLCAKLLRAGHAVRYEAIARVYHSHQYSLQTQFKRYFDIGVVLGRSPEIHVKGRLGGEGVRYVREQTRYLLGRGAWRVLPRSFAESALKLAAVSLGRRERLIPTAVKKRLSLHSFFW